MPVGTSVFALLSRGWKAASCARTAIVSAVAVALVLLGSVSMASAQSTATITAAWDRNTDAMTTGYMLQYGTSPGSSQWSYDAGNQTSAQVTLSRGQRYYVSVRAYNSSAQMSPPSNEEMIDLTTTTAAPTATITASLQNATTALVSWQTANAVSATINGTAVGLSGSTSVPVSATTTFTIVATSASGATATQSATVTVTPPPAAPTAQITATLQNGTTAVVTWQTTNATSARINGASVALNGTTSVPVSATTTFTIVATSASGATATRSATVTVTPPPAAPTAQITAALQNGTTAVVTWQTTNATSARINGATVALNGTTSVPVSATTTFTIVATSASGATATQSATVNVTPPPPPAAPTATVTATLKNPTTALVSWQTTNAVNVTINGVSVGLNGSQTLAVSTTTTFTLVATGSGGATVTRSATVVVSPPATGAPSAPTNMASTVSGTRVNFSWRAPTAGATPDRYLVDVGLSGTTRMLASGYPVGNVLSVSANLPKGRYNARVRAANAAGVSGYSNLVSFKVGRTLASPKGLTARWVGSTAIISWTVASADGSVENTPTSYVLEAGTAEGMADVATVNLGNTTTFSAPIPSGTYYVRVRAENDYGDSEPTPDLVLVPPGAPNAPTTLVHSRVNGNVNLRWNAPNGPAPTGYLIEAGSAPGLSDLARAQVGTATFFSAPVPPGTYYVRVRAINDRGPGLPSNEVVVR